MSQVYNGTNNGQKNWKWSALSLWPNCVGLVHIFNILKKIHYVSLNIFKKKNHNEQIENSNPSWPKQEIIKNYVTKVNVLVTLMCDWRTKVVDVLKKHPQKKNCTEFS